MPRSVTFKGPFAGIEERESVQGDNHCAISINVDYSNGYIEPRGGFSYHTGGIPKSTPTAAILKLPDGRFYLCSLSYDQDAKAIKFIATNSTLKTTYTTTLSEPSRSNLKCGWIQSILPVDADGDGVKETPHPVLIFVTEYNTYIYDPIADETAIRVADISSETPPDARKKNKDNVSYWKTNPNCTLAENHLGRTFYAGWRPFAHVKLDHPLDDEQDQVPESMVNQNFRSNLTMVPHVFVWSDELDPLGIPANQILTVDPSETITGLKSWQEQLVIFTNRSVYSFTGGTQETYALHKAVSGIGCVAQDSIVDVGDALMFMSNDGIYGFVGYGTDGSIVKLSKPIDSLWTGRVEYEGVAKGTFGTYLKEDFRYPYFIDASRISMCKGLFVQSRNQVWWSIPISWMKEDTNADPLAFNLTLVYDYSAKAWSYWIRQGLYNGDNELFHSGVTVREGTLERVFSFGKDELNEYIGQGRDRVASGDPDPNYTIPMAWVSGRLLKGNEVVVTARPVRLKMMAYGRKKGITSDPRFFLIGEEGTFDHEAGGVQKTESQFTEGKIDLHPDETNKYFYGTSGVGKWRDAIGDSDAFYFTGTEWFSSKIEPGAVRSKTFRFGIMDPGNSSDDDLTRHSALKVQSFEIEFDGGKGDER